MYFRQLNPRLGNWLGLWLFLRHIQSFILMHANLLTLHFTDFTNFSLLHRLYLSCGSYFSVQYTMALPCFFFPRSCILFWLWSTDSHIPIAYSKGISPSLNRVLISKLDSTDTLMLHDWVKCPKYARKYSKISPSFEFCEMYLSKVWLLLGVPSGVCQLTQGVALLLVKVSAW